MITPARITDCFHCLVGWRESAKATECYDALTNQLKHSDSGLYFNNLSGVSLEMINEMKGKDFDTVNDYLDSLQNAAALDLINRFVTKQKQKLYTKALLSNYAVDSYVQNIRNYTLRMPQGQGRFLGYEIRPHQSNSIKAEVMQLGGMFKELQSELTIYFYSSKQKDALATFTVNINKQNSVVFFDLATQVSGSLSEDCPSIVEVICEYINKDNGNGARYYLGYYEDDLDVGQKSVDTRYRGYNGCTSCGSGSYRKHNEYVTISPIEVSVGHLYSGNELFDTDAIGYSDQTYGLSMKLNVVCDISDVICDNRILFSNAFQKSVAIRVLWDAYNSNEFNSTIANQKQNWRLMAEKYEMELNGYQDEAGYHYGDLDSLSIDFSNIDQQCLGSLKGVMGIMNL